MTLPTTAELPYAKTTTPPLDQLVPDMDLAAYRFRAVIDWIEFRMHFAHGVQVQRLQPVMQSFFARNTHNIGEDRRASWVAP